MKHTALGMMSAMFCASAFGFEIAAWRGETVAELPPDNVELGEAAPAGLGVRVGTLRPVRYALKIGAMQFGEAYDRVEWGVVDGNGPRVVEVSVPADAKPGVYRYGTMDIRVIDRVLPPAKDWKYYLDLWQHPWAVARVAKVKPFSKEHYAAMRPVYELLASAGQKALTVSILEQPWNHQCYDAYHSMIGREKLADGSWKFDYTVFDEFVEFGRSCGIGPDIACYTLCSWGSQLQPGSEGYEEYWSDFLVDFAKHLKAKGWYENTLIAMDERTPEQVKLVSDFLRKRAPGMRIAMAGNRKPSDFKGIDINVYAQVLMDKYLTPEFLAEAKERRARGFVTTHYVCCSPLKPNTFTGSGAGEAFFCGAVPAAIGLDGFLRWAWNSWPQNPNVDSSYGTWSPGDTYLCYPGGAPSWRFLDLRNGIAAAEKLRILRESGADTAEIDRLYVVADANSGKCDYADVRKRTLGFVNRK